MTHILPFVAAIAFIVTTLVLMNRTETPSRSAWIFPAILSGVFFAWTMATVYYEGPLGFWEDHVLGMWGNQIWFDLLLALGIGWFFLVPRAQALNMRLPLWLLFIICSGSIGMLAMLSRLLFLQTRTES